MKLKAFGENVVCEEVKIVEEKTNNPLIRSNGLDNNLVYGEVVSSRIIMPPPSETGTLREGQRVFFRKDEATPIRGQWVVNKSKILCIGEQGE